MQGKKTILMIICAIVGAFIGVTLARSAGGSVLMLVLVIAFVGWMVWFIKSNNSKSGNANLADSSTRKEALRFIPHPELATLYVARPQFVGFAMIYPITINDQTLPTKGKTFYRFDLPAGTYHITSDNKLCTQNLTVELQAGEITYAEIEIIMGKGYIIKKMDDITQAQKDIMLCKMLRTS